MRLAHVPVAVARAPLAPPVPPGAASPTPAADPLEWCGGTSRKGDYVNVSLGWDRERGPWWRGENGLFHGDCTSAYGAHRACVCDEPAPERESHGDCAHCGRFVPFGRKPAAVEANRVFQRLAPGERPTPEMLDYVREIYRQERESARREPSA